LERGRIRALTGELNLAELRYVTGRKVGWVQSSQIVQKLLSSEYLSVLPAGEFLERAAQMKCARALSFVDCITISMAESMNQPVLFSSREEELDKEIKRKAFSTKILFLDAIV